jgi:hypothetical protein
MFPYLFKTNVLHNDLKKDAINEFGIKYWTSNPAWELLLCEYWRKSMIIGEKNTDLKRLTRWLKLGRFHWNQGEEVAHIAWFDEPCVLHLHFVVGPIVDLYKVYKDRHLKLDLAASIIVSFSHTRSFAMAIRIDLLNSCLVLFFWINKGFEGPLVYHFQPIYYKIAVFPSVLFWFHYSTLSL